MLGKNHDYWNMLVLAALFERAVFGKIEKRLTFGHFLSVFTPDLCKCALNYLKFSEKILPNEFYTICKNHDNSIFFALVALILEKFPNFQVKFTTWTWRHSKNLIQFFVWQFWADFKDLIGFAISISNLFLGFKLGFLKEKRPVWMTTISRKAKIGLIDYPNCSNYGGDTQPWIVSWVSTRSIGGLPAEQRDKGPKERFFQTLGLTIQKTLGKATQKFYFPKKYTGLGILLQNFNSIGKKVTWIDPFNLKVSS